VEGATFQAPRHIYVERTRTLRVSIQSAAGTLDTTDLGLGDALVESAPFVRGSLVRLPL